MTLSIALAVNKLRQTARRMLKNNKALHHILARHIWREDLGL